ncbi:MAG: gfo/Idh/MocA family oxidoreductase [Marinilabiliales bacterium]|nr:MAG: gfo/Idh/MocA family oxidoreductase [Marinilabiliales bacterium]
MSKHPRSRSRREFIGNVAALGALGATGAIGAGTAGALGAGSILTSCSPRGEKYVPPVFPERAPDGPPLKAGLIGCGGRGTGAAFNFIDAGPNLQITAVTDLFQDRIDRCREALKEQRGVEIPDENCFTGLDGYKKVIDSGVDIILEASVSKFRPKHFEAAVQARKHCFIEKPAGVDPVGMRSVMASGRMAEAAGLSVVAGTQRRHQLDYIHTYAQIRNGAIGDLVSANCYWLRNAQAVTPRQSGWCDFEAMIRDRANWIWQTGDSLANLLVHNLDVVIWFFGKHPVNATGFGGRHRRRSGDMYDFFSVDFTFDDNRSVHGMTREIDGCHNNVGELILGTKGYTNCQNRIWDYNGNLIWEYPYPVGDDGQPTYSVAISPYDQEIINLVTAIRTNNPINEAGNLAVSSMISVMGRESAYTGRQMTWEDMMNSSLEIGPDSYEFGIYEGLNPVVPVPGTSAG